MLFFTRGVLCPREEDPCRGGGLYDYRAIQFGGPSFRFLFRSDSTFKRGLDTEFAGWWKAYWYGRPDLNRQAVASGGF